MTAPSTPRSVVTPGITVMEASAGTGKTHALTSLAVRAVADGLPLGQMLLMSFTRSTTAELRSRVRDRLVEAEDLLTHFLHSGVVPEDATVAPYCTDERDAVVTTRTRIHEAVAEFDAATIVTIHGFCQRVLDQIGVSGDVDLGVTFVEDLRELTKEVVDDLLVQKFHTHIEDDRFLDRSQATAIADAVLADANAEVVPGADTVSGLGLTRVRFGHAVRDRVDRRKRERNLLGYDDLLVKLRDALSGPDGLSVARRLQRTYRLVVVDEFQDTDTVQWDIMRMAFGTGHTSLVLIGDPKQAIYSFRGADVHAYLAARDAATVPVERLAINWRSDAGLLRGLDAVFGDTRLGHGDIIYHPSAAAPHHVDPGLTGGRRPIPLRIRHLRRDTPNAVLTANYGDLTQPWAVERVAEDLSAEIVHQLRTPPRLTAEDRDLRASDIAVLVQRNQDAELVRAQLAAVGVAAVVNGTGSVFASAAAQAWLTLLTAIEQPAFTAKIRAAVLTDFVGWSADLVATADEQAWDHMHEQLLQWQAVLVEAGIAALFEHVQASTDMPARLLALADGDRALTDLRHVAELLHEYTLDHDATPATLLAWLRVQIAESDRAESDATRRRLDTDADAVQVWTVHRSKGLEFPVVYLPYLWRPQHIPDEVVPRYHVDEVGRVVNVVAGRSSTEGRAAEAEQRGEELRLAYVALTRARHQVVLWWASTKPAADSPLARLLLDPVKGSRVAETPPDDGIRTALDMLAAKAAADIAIEDAVGATDAIVPPAPTPVLDLGVRAFDRTLDWDWRRTSYSALTAVAHDRTAHPDTTVAGHTAPEHDDRGLEDERELVETDDDGVAVVGPDPSAAPTTPTEEELAARLVPAGFEDLVGGTSFGTMVHAVLEHTDFTAADLPGAVSDALDQTSRVGVPEVDSDAIVTGLVNAIRTPLGPLVHERRLRDISRADRLDELHFELPLAGGDFPVGHVTMAAIADVVRTTFPADDLLAGYDVDLADPILAQAVRGYLSGSIDVVLRSQGRYFVIDHKSNWLGTAGEPLTAWHYRPEALRDAMVRAHYPLQAMLYSVALHRYLRGRLPNYDPDQDLGGIVYLFLRGMVGADVPRIDGQPCGVFAWRPPTATTLGLSDVLDRGDG